MCIILVCTTQYSGWKPGNFLEAVGSHVPSLVMSLSKSKCVYSVNIDLGREGMYVLHRTLAAPIKAGDFLISVGVMYLFGRQVSLRHNIVTCFPLTSLITSQWASIPRTKNGSLGSAVLAIVDPLFVFTLVNFLQCSHIS